MSEIKVGLLNKSYIMKFDYYYRSDPSKSSYECLVVAVSSDGTYSVFKTSNIDKKNLHVSLGNFYNQVIENGAMFLPHMGEMVDLSEWEKINTNSIGFI